ncbi:MAG: SIS domain-containing protein [Actinomycetota bacterium]|nr:SIS domain-containing protein [Actinomycetota bacterium]
MSDVSDEIASQPAVWRRAVAMLPGVAPKLPPAGARIAIIGCGTSYYMAQAIAVARESLGGGETDAFAASEMPAGRSYDAVLAISRSGTTTEVERALCGLPPKSSSLAISAAPGTPVVKAARDAVLLPFADEVSIVQTRFATTVLAMIRAHLGENLEPVIADAEVALVSALPAEPSDFEQFVFLGTGWTVGLANEAALKFREAGGAWAESYPAMEYRHGPISVAGPSSLVWLLGSVEQDLASDIRATGALVLEGGSDPMAELILLQRAAVALAEARGLNPDRPTHLSRSVVLP